MAEVFVIDRVVTAAGCAQRFIDAYLSGYAPGARERGMTLRDVLVSPPIWFDDRTNVVTVTWSLPSPEAWWEMTWKGRPDVSLAQWWSDISDLIVDRTRSVATAAGDVDDAAPAARDSRATSTPEMVCVTRLLDVTESERARVLGELREAAARSGAVSSVVQPTLPGSRNGGDVLVHLRFRNQEDWTASDFDSILTDPAIVHANGITYRGTSVRSGGDDVGSVYRALLLRICPEADPETVAAFENELAMMPDYVPTITAWQLSRVESAIGDSAWTHVFEQEFTNVEGLMGPYLMHPIHWAVVDRWFDPETTDVIVRDRICHSFCELSAPVL
jgi:hypothetical protein